jgi:hypothetical protein
MIQDKSKLYKLESLPIEAQERIEKSPYVINKKIGK